MRKILLTALFTVGGLVAGLACSNPDITAPISVTSGTGNFGLGVPIGSNPGTWVSYVPHNVTVSAELHFNATAPIGFPSTAQSHQASVHLKAQVCDESTTVTVQSGGKVILGDPATSRTTETRFLSGTTLVLESGSQLIVKEGSHLIMEEGSTIIFHSGASISASGSNARITFRGKVDVRSGAVFTFSGSGKWIFDQQIWQLDGNGNPYQALDNYWAIAANTEFFLDGQGQGTHQMLDIVNSFVPKTGAGQTFTKMTLKNGTVRLNADGPMHCFSALDFQKVTLTNIGAPKHAGFRLHETGNTYTIKDSRFEGGDNSLWLHWYGNTSNLTMINCDFSDNSTGMHIMAGGSSNFNFTLCDFEDNGTGLLADNTYAGNIKTVGCNFNRNGTGLNLGAGSMTLFGSPFRENGLGISAVITNASTIATCPFLENEYGASVVGYGVPDGLLCSSCSFIDNTIIGLLVGGGMDVRVECSKFNTNEQYGIYASDESEEDELRLLLNNEAYNQFADNGISAIGLESSSQQSPVGLYLDQGFNDFSFAPGTVFTNPTAAPFYVELNPFGIQALNSDFNGSGDIIADNNKMPLVTYTSPVSTQLPEFTPYDFQVSPNLSTIEETPCGEGGPGNGGNPGNPFGKTGQDQESIASFEQAGLVVYPQPVDRHANVTVELEGSEGAARLTIMGVDGRIVQSESLVSWNGRYTMSIGEMPSGLYLLTLELEDGRAYTRQLIVQ